MFAGACNEDTCHNPGQVCEESPLTGDAVCVCPDCEGQPSEPVCALIGHVVKTHESECEMRRAACEMIKTFHLLENRPCEGLMY